MSSFRQLMMREKGGGVEFKNAIYPSGSAYISLPLYQDLKKIEISGVVTNTAQYARQTFVLFYKQYSSAYSYEGYSIQSYIRVSAGMGYRDINFNNFNYSSTISTVNLSSLTSNDFNVTATLTEAINIVNEFKVVMDGKTKSIKLYNSNDVLIGELLPAIVNGENGMYDTVGQQFYTNANSVGSLVCE